MDRLIVICEGGVHTMEYLHKNGVYPSAMLIEPTKFQEISPYLTQEDDILLIINSLTDFTMQSIYGLLGKFKEYESRYKRVTIFSNIPLGSVSYDYYLYSGDLFYGDVCKISNKKKIELDENGNEIAKNEKKVFLKKRTPAVKGKNPIMLQFRKYNNKKVKLMIYGRAKGVGIDEVEKKTSFEYEDKIKVIDLYKNS